MKFSIIMPTYNRENCLDRTINYILNLDYSDWELITVDDCSKDESYNICRKYSEKDNRIIALKNEVNSGPSVSRNAGLRIATGDYVLFLDDDDGLAPETLSVLSDTVNKYNNPDFIVFGYSSGNSKRYPSDKLCNMGVIGSDFIYKNILPEHINIKPQDEMFLLQYACSKCYKNSFLRENGILFDDFRRTWEDNPFLVKCLAKANSVVCIQNTLYQLIGTGNDDHLSAKFSLNMLWGYMQTYTEYSERFGEMFDFNNEYTCHRYFGNVCNIMRGLQKSISAEEYSETADKLLQDKRMEIWVNAANCKNSLETSICNAFKNKDKQAFIEFIGKEPVIVPEKTKLSAKVIRKVKRIIKSIIK